MESRIGWSTTNLGLSRHQEEALDFMIQRETGNISENYRLWKPKMVEGEQM